MAENRCQAEECDSRDFEVVWSPLFGKYLCAGHLADRTTLELAAGSLQIERDAHPERLQPWVDDTGVEADPHQAAAFDSITIAPGDVHIAGSEGEVVATHDGVEFRLSLDDSDFQEHLRLARFRQHYLWGLAVVDPRTHLYGLPTV